MFSVVDITESDEWDSIVSSFSNYDVYYLAGYSKAFQLHGDGEPLLLYYEGETLRGINVVMKRDVATDSHFSGKLPENTYFDFATPYGYGGWLIEGDRDSFELFESYQSWCQKNNIVSEFVRYHPILKNHERSDPFYNVLALGSTIAMDLSSPEVIWRNLTGKNRNMIRKAQKSGIAIYNGRYPEIYEKFREIYNITMDKDNAESYYYFKSEFYDSILHGLAQEAQVFYAVLGEKVIAASIMLSANGCLNYHLSGSLQEYKNLAPTNLLLYKAALWGYSNGCKTLHLGGGVGSVEDSLYGFKKAFYRGKPHRFYIGRKIYINDKYNELVQMRDDVSDSEFFPKYRA